VPKQEDMQNMCGHIQKYVNNQLKAAEKKHVQKYTNNQLKAEFKKKKLAKYKCQRHNTITNCSFTSKIIGITVLYRKCTACTDNKPTNTHATAPTYSHLG
jgi:hypothetical protein